MCVNDFLHEPYNSVTDPLDLLFMGLTPGTVIPDFGIGYSIGMTKAMAGLAILTAAINLQLTDTALATVAPELAALLVMAAHCDPAGDIEDQVYRSVSRKMRASERSRPQVLQLEFAFRRILEAKRAQGDRRPNTPILAAIMRDYNTKQPNKNRVTPDERDAVLFLQAQLPEFKTLLANHWKNFPAAISGVPVSYLAKPFLHDAYEPPVRRQTHPKLHEHLSTSPEKRVVWLQRVIGKYMKNLQDAKNCGRPFNLRSMGVPPYAKVRPA